MFGYILPEKPELKVKEYEMFRAYYCGICKALGRRSGQLSRLTLNYDTTFLAVLLSSVSDESLEIRNEVCIAHPVTKRHVILNNSIVEYAADMNIMLTYLKLKDDWQDDRSAISGTAMVALRRSFMKARRKNREKSERIEAGLRKLSQLERQGCDSLDMVAEPFAGIMEEIMAYPPLCVDEGMSKILRWIGYNVGKWIYIIDAYDDLEKDFQKKSYNPFLARGSTFSDITQLKKSLKEEVEFTLTYTLSQIAQAYDFADKKINGAIVDNIIYMGMRRKTDSILNVGSCNNIEKSV